MWHRFTPSSDDDHTCTNCDLIVDDAAVELVAIDCPAEPCTEETNPGPCVMVATEGGVRCAYCDRTGTLEQDDGDDDAAWLDNL